MRLPGRKDNRQVSSTALVRTAKSLISHSSAASQTRSLLAFAMLSDFMIASPRIGEVLSRSAHVTNGDAVTAFAFRRVRII